MLYFKALFDGLDDMPAANAAIRAALEQEAVEKGWPALHAELHTVDPMTAARLAPADSQRIQRALEVYRVSGLPLSHFHSTQGARETGHGGPDASASMALISLEPMDRSWLHMRIAQRFDTMLAQGFVDEVRSLRARGDLHPDLPSMRCVGYRQVWQALDAQQAAGPSAPLALDGVRELGIIATRQLAKRQMTWLRSMQQRQILAADQSHPVEAVLQLVSQILNRQSRQPP
jgi:tRNA dimethylallyltransferase